jgi:hypothetical protein
MGNLVHTIKQGDLRPSIKTPLGTLQDDGSISPDNLTGCTVVLNATLGNQKIITDAPVTIVDAANGQVQYDFQSGNTNQVGDLQAEFKVTDSLGRPERYPNNGNFVIKVYRQVGP